MKNTALRTSRLLIVASFVAVASVLGLSAAENGSNSSSTMWPGGNWMPPAASYGTKQDLQVSVPMSDGVVLKADISYPTDPTTGNRAPGPFPVLLTQTPYASKKPTDGDFFVQRGYIYVTAYVRGTLTSGGSYGFFSDRDAKDGAELVAWAAGKVRNSNGVVGLHGDSYMAITQMFTVAAAGPGSPVKAMAASCMGAEFYPETYFAGGIPTQTMNFQRVIGKLMGGDTAASGSATLADVLAGGDKAYYRDFWKARTVGNLVQQAVDTDVPLLLYSSSGDIYAQSSMDLYAYLQNAYAKRPIYGPMHTDVPATGRYQIIMGQGGHCKNQDVTIQLEWFETWLKKQPTNMEKTTMPIHVNEQISSKWFNTSHYPVVSAYTKYFLDNSGTLSQNQPSATAEETLPWAQPSASSRAQYESPIFSEGATLAGPITASLFASSTTSNLELIGTLQEIALDGTVTTLTSGTVLGSMSQNDPTRSWVDKNGVPVRPYGKYDADRYVPAGTIKQYDFLIYSRFAFVRPGSKLRFVLTTQAPTDICSPFLGTDPCFPTAPQTASLTGSRITIHHGPSYPSAVNLPLLKAGCWNPSGKVTGPFWKTDPTMPDTTSPCQE